MWWTYCSSVVPIDGESRQDSLPCSCSAFFLAYTSSDPLPAGPQYFSSRLSQLVTSCLVSKSGLQVTLPAVLLAVPRMPVLFRSHPSSCKEANMSQRWQHPMTREWHLQGFSYQHVSHAFSYRLGTSVAVHFPPPLWDVDVIRAVMEMLLQKMGVKKRNRAGVSANMWQDCRKQIKGIWKEEAKNGPSHFCVIRT